MSMRHVERRRPACVHSCADQVRVEPRFPAFVTAICPIAICPIAIAQLLSPNCYLPICRLLLTLASLIPSPAQRDGLTTQDTNGRRPTFEVIATALHIQRRQPDREAYQET